MKTFPIPSKPAPSGGEDNPKERENDNDNDDTKSYARGGWVKGEGAKAASYAEGGPVYGRTRDFMKAPNQFTDLNDEADENKRGPSRYESTYGKKGADTVKKGEPNPSGKWKSEAKTPTPRK